MTEALARLADRISVAFVYGSMARQQEREESDIDVLVVGRATLEDLLGALAKVEASLRRAVNPTVYSVSEFKRKLSEDDLGLGRQLRLK